LTQINPDGTETTRYEFTPEERAALEYARQNNVLIVAAAGNDGNVMSVLGQASQEFDNIITVGSAENLDSSVAPAKGFDRVDYSSYGYGLDIMAEGGTIDNPVLSTAGDGLGTMAGTSVATAEVTSAASQVWAANPELSYQQVIDILKSTATDLNTANWDTETGTGLLNVAAAVSLAKVTTPEVYTPEAFSIPITWGGEGKVTPTERAALSAEQIGQQPTGDTYASGYIAPFKGGATLTQDWNSNHTHNGKSAYAKDWVIADSKVYAAKSGTVIAVKEDSTIYGDSSAYANDANYVIIHHDDGYESMYLHLETGSVPIEVGDYVEAGTYIGLTGLSGWTSGEHLHFVVRNSSTKYSVPFKLDGSDANYQNPQTPTPDPSGVVSANFSASVMATAGANIRSGPGTNYAIVGGSPYQSNLEFDAWTYGETVTDVSLGTPDARWYRIKGTNNWVASAVVNGNAPGSTPLPPDNSSSSPEVVEESFSGWVGSSNGVNLRNSPSHADRGPLNEPYEKTLYFDAWTYGEVVRDLWTDEEDALWYRVAGTNYWVPSAYIAGYPGSQPPLLPPDNSDSSGGHTVSGSFLPVWQQYQGTLGNATSEVIDYSGGVSYQLFENGSIVSSQHGTFPLYGAIRQTYLGTGGLNGDLGAPTSAEVNQGNGVIKQTFENGYIIWNGAKATVYEYDDPQDDQSNVPLPDVAPDISPSNGLSANMRAFLDTIAYAEGTNYVDGYRTIFTYQTFDSFDDHPRTVFCSGNLCSDAAGRYQFLSSTWDSVRSAIGATDFSPYYQDLGAVELIKRRGALEDVENGNIQAAIEKCSWEWASFPPGRYGQPQKSMDELLQVYQDSLAKYT
jgi:muramidase (phage lysozyme)/murein DD-endopeptidase MepM/ murein hydrolase activator NlpD